MDSLKFHPGPPCPTLLHPVGGPPLKRPYGRFRGGPPARWAACSHILPLGYPVPYAYAEKSRLLRPQCDLETFFEFGRDSNFEVTWCQVESGAYGKWYPWSPYSYTRPGPTMPDPSTPCRRATPETALLSLLGWSARRAGVLRPSSTTLDTPRRTGLGGVT
jgi:hypothetical protein